MTTSPATELALRAAANTGSRNLTTAGGQGDAIKSCALQRLQGQSMLNSNGMPGSSSISGIETAAVVAAVAVVAVGSMAIKDQMGVLQDKRLAFDKEREAGIATFMLPHNKEARDFSNEEIVVKGFIELGLSYPSFSTYLGLHSAELSDDTNGTYYSVLPFYRMSEKLGQPLASTRPLDRQRTAINLFFKSSFPDAIADIDTSFQTDWRFVAFWESVYQGKNYLNDRRAPRLIMMCLSNLLWNLQHPVDADGFPLGLNRCIEICREVELYLIQLLNSSSPPYMQTINNDENDLISFMRKIEVYIKTLHAAYVEEQLHELNIDEITNSAHSALRIMDKSLFKLIYKKYNPLTKKEEPNDKAAETLADTVSYLNLLFKQNATLVEAFLPIPTWISQAAGINTPPTTIIDVLILFCHLSGAERKDILSKIKKTQFGSALEFAKTLEKFNEKFIRPIKVVSKKELDAGVFSSKHEAVGSLTARRLVPFITLVIEDFRIEVDTPETYACAKKSQANSTDSTAIKLYSGIQQVQAINLSAQTGDGYYTWALSPFTEGTKALDDLPKYQYRMTQVSKLMDSVSELVKNYRSFLLQKSFQVFLLNCLTKVKAENADLERRIAETDVCLDQNEGVSRSLQFTLRMMTSDLNHSLDAFSLAMSNFEHVVSAPDFTDKQRELLSTKVCGIAEQFSSLFAEDSGLAALVNLAPKTDAAIEDAPVTQSTPHANAVKSNAVIAVRNLVQSCHEALSSSSKRGNKGVFLRYLLDEIDGAINFSEEDIAQIIMELTRVTASYRETSFFQAAYGETRSVQPLLRAIKDPTMNTIVPLASLFFGRSDVDTNKITDEMVLQRLRRLREADHRWQESSNQMKVNWTKTTNVLEFI